MVRLVKHEALNKLAKKPTFPTGTVLCISGIVGATEIFGDTVVGLDNTSSLKPSISVYVGEVILHESDFKSKSITVENGRLHVYITHSKGYSVWRPCTIYLKF